MIVASIPSPPVDWQVPISLGPLSVHSYALCILAGIFVAIWLTTRRWVARGGDRELVGDLAIWAIPFGIVGGRLYHVVTTPGPYFGENGNPAQALRIWDGGLGIWGAVALGALGAYIGCRRARVSFTTFLDAAAPGVLFAQAIGRLGNWFNQELFGAPTDLPWALQIDPQYRPAGYAEFETFHPTFLYELLWNVAGAFVILYLDKRLRLWGGRVFWLYVFTYTLGRLWIENVRIDDAEIILGLRLNVWTSIIVLVVSGVVFWQLGRRQRAAGAAPDLSTLASSSPKLETAVEAAVQESAADAVTEAPAAKASAKRATATATKAPAKRATATATATKASAKDPATKAPAKKAPAKKAATAAKTSTSTKATPSSGAKKRTATSADKAASTSSAGAKSTTTRASAAKKAAKPKTPEGQ